MKYTYLGHASFLIETEGGIRLVTDPYPQSIMAHKVVDCHYVTLSHKHFDHCDLSQVKGNFTVIDSTAPFETEGLKIYGIDSYHDDCKGQKRGGNIIFVIEADNERFCHLGDLGEHLSKEQIAAIGAVDCLFVPVGGTYTLNPQQAAEVVCQLKPIKTVPMHYHMQGHSFDILRPQSEFWEQLDAKKR